MPGIRGVPREATIDTLAVRNPEVANNLIKAFRMALLSMPTSRRIFFNEIRNDLNSNLKGKIHLPIREPGHR